MTKILIEDGDVFEGDFEQFSDCFFSFRDGADDQEKIHEIYDWANMEGFDVQILEDEE